MEEQHDDPKQGTIFYKNTAEKLSLASKVSYFTRKRVFSKFIEILKPIETLSVLDVGATSDDFFSESNFFEMFYPYKKQITCVGIEDASYLETKYPGVQYIPVKAGEPLPFIDGHFDIAFSNAVVEHTGSRSQQEYFINEVVRVSKRFFIITPNRWFPIETHTFVPFLHWLPVSIYRRIFRMIGLGLWAKESNLNLLDKKTFLELFPSHTQVKIHNIRFLGFVSNLIAVGDNVLNAKLK